MHFHHRIDDRRWSTRITDAPASHGERLRKAVQKNRSIRHSREARDTRVRSIEGELRIDFIREHQQIFFDAERRDLFELFARALPRATSKSSKRAIAWNALSPGRQSVS